MPLFSFEFLALIQIALVFHSLHWMIRRNDEIPLAINSLLFYVVSCRYWSVQTGQTEWVDLSYYTILRPITQAGALEAFQYILLGQICLIGAYVWKQRSVVSVAQADRRLRPVLDWIRSIVFGISLCILPLIYLLTQFVSGRLSAGASLAFQISGYLHLFPLILISIATLILLIWRFGGMHSSLHKIIALIILVAIGQFTWGVSGRFRFLGWIITSGVIISSFYRPKIRILILGLCTAFGSTLFALAGSLRERAETSLEEASLARILTAEDANMLDGFANLKQAFPDIVPFRLGMAHLEILLRPIPRALWPGKPSGGGYLEAIGLVDRESGFTLGFSPTLFGDFYSEAGIIGIIFLSIVYGIILALVVRWSIRLHPFLGVLVRAIILATLVPLFRGGDLAGIWAWIGMAFWPCFLIIWLVQKRLRRFFPYGISGHYAILVQPPPSGGTFNNQS